MLSPSSCFVLISNYVVRPELYAGPTTVSACRTVTWSRLSSQVNRTGSPRRTTGTPRPSTPTVTGCSRGPKPPRRCGTPSSSRSRGWTGSVILTGSMPGCTPSRGTSACGALDPKTPKPGPKDPRTRRRRGGARRSPGSGDPDELPAVTLPTELRGQVLTACADNSPAGRARRVSVTHRAGVFGPSGFPKAIGPAGALVVAAGPAPSSFGGGRGRDGGGGRSGRDHHDHDGRRIAPLPGLRPRARRRRGRLAVQRDPDPKPLNPRPQGPRAA